MHLTINRAVVAAALAIGVAWSSPAMAADNAMQVCGAKYRAAKTAGTVPAGQTWNQFLATCRAGLPKADAVALPAKAVPAKKVTVAKTVTAKVSGQLSPAQTAERSRIKQCAAQWQADKAANKTAGQTWPHYWSACSKRLKG